MPEATAKPLLLLVDGHSLAFRSFYAFSKGGEGGLATKDGRPTSVTYGFLKALLDNSKTLKPEGVAIAFDTAEPTFRHKADANYKAHRDVAPEVFFQDLEQLQQILETHLQLPLCMAPGYEADDVLGTLANRAADSGWGVRILSGDRDLFQLVDDSRDIAVLYMGGGPYAKSSGPTLIREEGVLGKLGVMPDKVVDLKALTGDSSDNIPGVRGVGPKTAINLLKDNSDLDAVYATLEQVEAEGPKASRGAIKGALKGKLRADRDNAYLSRKLAEILVDVPLPKEPSLPLSSVDADGLSSCLEDLELNSLLRQVGGFVAAFSEGGYGANAEAAAAKTPRRSATTEPAAAEAATEPTTQDDVGLPALKPQLIQTETALDALVQRLMACTDSSLPVAFDTETTDLNPFRAELVGIGICWGEALDALAYIPLGHKGSEDSSPEQLPLETVLTALAPWLASSNHPKALQNAKYDRLILLRHGVALEGVVIDTLLADYLRDAAAKHGLELMAEREFGFQPTAFTDLVGKKSKPSPMCRWSPPACTAAWTCTSPIASPCCCDVSWRPWVRSCCHCWSRWSSRWNRCWPGWNPPESALMCPISRAFPRRWAPPCSSWNPTPKQPLEWTSTWPHPSSWGSCCSTPLAWIARNPGAPKPASAPTPPCWRNSATTTRWCPWCWSTGCSASSRARTSTPCRSWWRRKPGGSTPISTRP